MSSYSSENDNLDDIEFTISDFLSLGEERHEGYMLPPPEYQQHQSPHHGSSDHLEVSRTGGFHKSWNTTASTTLKGVRTKVAFKTKSEREILDDGYKWRKYGKKMVKNSPNPRNYYRCSSEGCNVKKRVERQREDSSYVITTYEGVHNHHAPSTVSVSAHHSAASSPGFPHCLNQCPL